MIFESLQNLEESNKLLKKIVQNKVPQLHEIWTWQGDTSVLPHKVVEIINQVSIYDPNDPQFKNDDPFDFEKPYRSEDVKKRIKML